MRRTPRWRRWLRRLALFTAATIALLAACILLWLSPALYHHWVTFPRDEAAWQSLRAQRQSAPVEGSWHEYRGILHSHSHFSHDSEMPFDGIWQAMNVAHLDFICLSDHCIDGRADFSWQWRGVHNGKLFVPGFEMNDGIMPFGVATGIVLSNRTEPALLARQIVSNGGVLFYAHPEERRDWERPELTGMEIYNLHTDFKRQDGGIRALLPEIIINLNRYPDHLYRQMFHRPIEFLDRWDALNRTRHITGIAGNDCHQNVGFRGFYETNGTIRVEDTSPRTLTVVRLNAITRILARVAWGELKPGRKLFHVQLDPYERSARYVNTHLLAHELSESAILDALRAGRAFIGFDMLADSSGFQWFARDGLAITTMGETTRFNPMTHLHAFSPLPCRFTVIHDESKIHEAEGRTLDWLVPAPGKYRVEAELSIRGKWVPWVYCNPIDLHQ